MIAKTHRKLVLVVLIMAVTMIGIKNIAKGPATCATMVCRILIIRKVIVIFHNIVIIPHDKSAFIVFL